MADVTPADKAAREAAKVLREAAKMADNGQICGGVLMYQIPGGDVERIAFGEIYDGYQFGGNLLADAIRFIHLEEFEDDE